MTKNSAVLNPVYGRLSILHMGTMQLSISNWLFIVFVYI